MTIRQVVSVLLLLVAGLPAAGAAAQSASSDPAADRKRLEQRVAAVEMLIENSSAARQVEAAGSPAARQGREQARELIREARAALQAGNHARVAELLPQASSRMFEAVRAAAPEQVTSAKASSDFDARLDGTRSLLAAFRRIASEKPDAAGAAETSRDIESRIGDAERLAREGRSDGARVALEQAYLLAKAAVSSLRGGDTLVRSLSFSSREEEYRYEVDRNETHQMLLKVLLDGRPRSAEQQSAIGKALQLRSQADHAAARSDHVAGVRLLEESTRELIRAIRSAGVFIPS